MAILRKTVSLNPGQSKGVTFSYTPTEARPYQVLVNGLTGSFTAIEVPEIVLDSLNIIPTEPYLGETVAISAIAWNISDRTGTRTVACKVKGEIIGEVTVTLEPGKSQGVRFVITPEAIGKHSVEVDGLKGSFTVLEVPEVEEYLYYACYPTLQAFGSRAELESYLATAPLPPFGFVSIVSPKAARYLDKIPIEVGVYLIPNIQTERGMVDTWYINFGFRYKDAWGWGTWSTGTRITFGAPGEPIIREGVAYLTIKGTWYGMYFEIPPGIYTMQCRLGGWVGGNIYPYILPKGSVTEVDFPFEVTPTIYECPYCGATFGFQSDLSAHIETEHPEMT